MTTRSATSWNPNSNYDVNDLVVDGSTVYVGGGFSSIGGQPRNNIAALDAATGAATSWDPNVDSNGYVSALGVSGSTVFAGGFFTSVGGQTRNYIAALDAATGTATSWNPNPDYRVTDLAVSGNTVYAAGDFRTIGVEPQSRLAALSLPTVDVAVLPETHTPSLSQTIPNPARSRALIHFTLPAAQRVSLAVHDLQGRLVVTLLDEALESAGPHEVRVKTEGWRPGLYLYRLEAGGSTATRKMLVMK